MTQPAGWVPPGAPGNPTAAAIPIYSSAPREFEDQAARAAEYAQAKQVLAEMGGVTDPIERLVRAVAAFSVVSEQRTYGPGGRVGVKVGILLSNPRASYLDLIEAACPGWNPGCDDAGTWDDGLVASWFAEAALRAGAAHEEAVAWPEPHRSWRGKPKVSNGNVVLEAGPDVGIWRIPGTLLGGWFSRVSPAIEPPKDVFISIRGELHAGFTTTHTATGDVLIPASRLTSAALWYLAKLLKFPVRATDIVPSSDC